MSGMFPFLLNVVVFLDMKVKGDRQICMKTKVPIQN